MSYVKHSSCKMAGCQSSGTKESYGGKPTYGARLTSEGKPVYRSGLTSEGISFLGFGNIDRVVDATRASAEEDVDTAIASIQNNGNTTRDKMVGEQMNKKGGTAARNAEERFSF